MNENCTLAAKEKQKTKHLWFWKVDLPLKTFLQYLLWHIKLPERAYLKLQMFIVGKIKQTQLEEQCLSRADVAAIKVPRGFRAAKDCTTVDLHSLWCSREVVT